MISKDIPLKRDWITLILSWVNRYIQCVGYFAAMFLRRNPRHPPKTCRACLKAPRLAG